MRFGTLSSRVVLVSLLMSFAFFTSLAQAASNTTTTLTSSANPSVYNQSVTLTATVTSSGGTPTGTVTFKYNGSSDNVNLVNGVATAPLPAFHPGSFNFTATYNGNSNFNSSTSNTLTQVVDKATPTITWPNPSAITYGTALSSTQLDASTTVGGSFVYNPPSGTVLHAGMNQSLSTTFTPTDTTDYTTAGANATITVNQAMPVITWPNPSAITYGTALGSTQLDATANVGGSFVYTPPSGTVLNAGNNQTLSTIFTPTDTTDYTTAPANATITVNQAVPVITWPNPSAITYGTALSSVQLDATANVGGTFSYNPPTGTVLNAGTNPQPLSATFTPTDTTDYTTAPANATITVNPAMPVITWPTPAAMTADALLTPTQLDATASFNGQTLNGNYAYNPPVGSAPSATLQVTFTPTGQGSSNFTTAQGSVQMTVFATNTFVVATNGKDSWSGFFSEPNPPNNPTDGPLASPAEAQVKVRCVGSNGTNGCPSSNSSRSNPITVLIRAGRYYLPLSPTAPGTLMFNSPNDSGTSTAGVTWSNYPQDAAPVLSGGVPVNPDPNTWPGANLVNLSGLVWNTSGGGNNLGTVYSATLPTTVNGLSFSPFETLYYNGVRRFRSRVHDSGTQTTMQSIGYYMEPGQTTPTCVSTANTPISTAVPTGGQTTQPLANCNLGTYLRVVGTISYNGTGSGATCSSTEYITDSNNSANTKCLDRFYYATTTTGGDPIANFLNVNGTYNNSGPTPCLANGNNHYPPGDVEIYLIDSWTVDVMRINCVDTTNKIIYLTGATGGAGNIYNYSGPTVGHRYLIENALDAFNTAAQTTGQTGIWFLDRSGSSGMVLKYIANSGENPTSDLIVIPQLPGGTNGSIPGSPATNYSGASLIYAPAPSTGAGLSYVTFSGINFAVDDFYPGAAGFNNDVNGEYTLPQAIDCESCVSVTFNGITVSQTSASGILIASPGTTGPQATGNTVEYSVFYDIGSSGIRVGHAPATRSPNLDVAADVVTGTSVHDNLIKGYSRIYADGEGIAVGNGNNNTFTYNTITDGYHAGISVCYNTCGPTSANNNVNGNNNTANFNLISNLMQGITSDGGSLYFNVGGPNSSATGNVIQSNVVYDTTDSTIIDNAKTAATGGKNNVPGSAYGGEGIYLDSQTANVQVSNNVVYNIDGNAIHISAGVAWGAVNASTNETPNTFTNNIFAFADAGMLTEQQPWAGEGCPSSGNVKELTLNENIFNFNKPNNNNAAFQVVTGCTNSCGETYSTYQSFSHNAYYNANTTTGVAFGSDTNAFQLSQTQGSLSPPTYSCNAGNYFPLSFGGTSCSWQEGSSGTMCKNSNNAQVGLPVTMDEDSGGVVYNSGFPASGNSTDLPSQYSFSGNNLTGPGTGFTTSLTDTAISNSGRCKVTQPPNGCLPDPAQNGVLPTLPNYSYLTF